MDEDPGNDFVKILLTLAVGWLVVELIRLYRIGV